MTTLSQPAPCGAGCCLSVRAYIEAHLDPSACLRPTDDAAEILMNLDRAFASDGGSRVTIKQMQDYLDVLRAERAG